jgi:hypothetical protein
LFHLLAVDGDKPLPDNFLGSQDGFEGVGVLGRHATVPLSRISLQVPNKKNNYAQFFFHSGSQQKQIRNI